MSIDHDAQSMGFRSHEELVEWQRKNKPAGRGGSTRGESILREALARLADFVERTCERRFQSIASERELRAELEAARSALEKTKP
jgi:hypothetical protein